MQFETLFNMHFARDKETVNSIIFRAFAWPIGANEPSITLTQCTWSIVFHIIYHACTWRI